jgi:phospholipid/cholesterol/gamma-HCH transport system permease protein
VREQRLVIVLRSFTEKLGKTTVRGVVELGYAFSLLIESFYWVILGYRRRQAVKPPPVFAQMMQIGIEALPIVTVLAFTIGMMLAIQGIATLRTFGAESQVVLGIALSVTREFSPLIIGILVAGRSGSALAARTGTMLISQEIDALRVIGISPVRYLVAPALLGMMIMLPALTFFADLVALLGGAVYSNLDLGMSIQAYFDRTFEVLEVDDIMQGIWKSLVFAVLITLVSFSNGFAVTAGAEGVGKATTRSVVLSITYIIIADMIFTFFLTR